MTRLCFIDTETTGLDPDRHEIWEVAMIVRQPLDGRDGADFAAEAEYVWQLPVDESKADLIALNIGGYHERRWTAPGPPISPFTMLDGRVEKIEAERIVSLDDVLIREPREIYEMDLPAWCRRFANLTWGAHLVGAVPSFDEQRLARLLRKHGVCPGWHYHLVDVEALAVGYVRAAQRFADIPFPSEPLWEYEIAFPWKSDDLSRAVGVAPPGPGEKHSALGDARWARSVFDAVLGAS